MIFYILQLYGKDVPYLKTHVSTNADYKKLVRFFAKAEILTWSTSG
jgi:hypothetical protein